MLAVIIFVTIFGLGSFGQYLYERHRLKGGDKHRTKSDNDK